MIRNSSASWNARPDFLKPGSTWSARPSTIRGASATWN
jgi:hypothetical protein